MKKILCVCALMVGMVVSMCGCNKQIIDLNYKFNYAYIQLQDGTVIQGEVDSWTNYEDGDQLQIKMGGKTYLVHSMNCTLIYDPRL